MLKPKKLNTKKSQIKYFLCRKCVMACRLDLYNLQTTKTAKKVTKNWNWSFLLKPPISTLPINLRWS